MKFAYVRSELRPHSCLDDNFFLSLMTLILNLSLYQMPQKIRELKAQLAQAGFEHRNGKGSHTVWSHPLLSQPIVLAGKDGSDAKFYQEKLVRSAISIAKGKY